jgi:hypothetical protein
MTTDEAFAWHRELARQLDNDLKERRFWLWIDVEPAGVTAEVTNQAGSLVAKVDEWLATLGDPANHRSADPAKDTFTETGVDLTVQALGKGEGAPSHPVVGNPERAFAYFAGS